MSRRIRAVQQKRREAGMRTPQVWKLKPFETTVENAHNIRKNISFFYYVAVRNTTTRGIDRIRACLSRNAQSS